METAEITKRPPGRPRKYPLEVPEAVLAKPEFNTEAVPVVVRRMNNIDLQRHGGWLIPALQERFGGPPLHVVNGWVRMWTNSNEYNFACTDNAVALAISSHDLTNFDVVIEELFTFSNDGHQSDEITLYNHFIQWGKGLHASEFRFFRADFRFNKVEEERRKFFKAEIADVKSRITCYVDL